MLRAHGDHLGSNSVTTDGSGAVVARMSYAAYGGTWTTSGTQQTDRLFTDQRAESAALGALYDYGARFYDQYLNRWLSADTIVPQAGNPQDLNRYGYARNNPLKYTDPSGHECEKADGSPCSQETVTSDECDGDWQCAAERTYDECAYSKTRCWVAEMYVVRDYLLNKRDGGIGLTQREQKMLERAEHDIQRARFDPNPDGTGTISVGFQLTGGAIGQGGSFGVDLVLDNEANVDIQLVPAYGSMLGGGGSGTLVVKSTNAQTVFDLAGSSGTFGGSVSADGLTAGADYIYQNQGAIQGTAVDVGFGARNIDPRLWGSPVEVHGFVGTTYSLRSIFRSLLRR